MELQLEGLQGIDQWGVSNKRPFIIAGPCSAETEEQLMDTATQLKNIGQKVIRAGIWKPRTRPGTFEGIGVQGLKWVERAKKELDVKFAVEVANAEHVELCLKYGVDILWIGARSTVNPFTVQDIADALKGSDVPVLIKNPINPDLSLWVGAIERVYNAGVRKLGAIHRGFAFHQKTRYRNVPMWNLAIELKHLIHDLPMICDPSHITGKRDMIQEVSQQALDLSFDGLIIESHRDPDQAWSDASQQVTPSRLKEILDSLQVRSTRSDDAHFQHILEEIRDQIDHADKEILQAIANRMNLSDKIGEYKKEKNVTVLQLDRWEQILESRTTWGKGMNLDANFVEDFLKGIHNESIRRQEEIMNQANATSK
ncbi:MAG: bifunctional 3-deoxy-7-phosphoheptulonate synthase/chorismate mutase type II [Cytophagales bacterium]|nr:bifunctional 3-deoxy-7-phosphoheptulonate synthase/chorismate mutase type II [Cytophagales bacterium]